MPDTTVRTETILDQLVAGKRQELAARLAAEPLAAVADRARSSPAPLPLAPALTGDTVCLIAEIKKASPAAGLLEAELEPVQRARSYVRGGAAAISILTEERRFLGSLTHLTDVRDALESQPSMPRQSKAGGEPRGAAHPELVGGRTGTAVRPPLLRKDFLFDPYHVFEARAAGADAILLIVAILQQSVLESLLSIAHELALSVVVEVHDEREVERALAAGAEIIGINNRDLHSFATSLDVTERLRPGIPGGHVVISESGIQTTSDVQRLAAAGIDAILVGEALMRSGDVESSVRAFSSIPKSSLPGGAKNRATLKPEPGLHREDVR